LLERGSVAGVSVELSLAQVRDALADGLALALEEGAQIVGLLAGAAEQAALGADGSRVGLVGERAPERGEEGLGALGEVGEDELARGAGAGREQALGELDGLGRNGGVALGLDG